MVAAEVTRRTATHFGQEIRLVTSAATMPVGILKIRMAMKFALFLSSIIVATCLATQAESKTLQVRFYPQGTVRVYEVEPRRGWNSALLQNVTVVNELADSVTLDRVEIDLMAEGEAIQTQRLTAKELERAAKKGAALQKAGLLESLKFQFRPDVLLAGNLKFAEDKQLPAKTAVLIPYRYFTFAGQPEMIRVRAYGHTQDASPVEGSGSVPLSFFKSEVKYSFPMKGPLFIGVGQSLHQGHRWVVPEEFALDIAKVGEGGLTYRGDGSKRTNYYAYGSDVLAAAAGTVVAVQDGLPESDDSLRRPTESSEAYLQRVLGMQDELLRKGPLLAAGNYVVIRHDAKEFSFYAHLLPGSIKTAKGERVHPGQVIAQLGHSGNSTEPHLHFHVVDGEDPLFSAGLPVHFGNIEIPLADGPREIQSGDIVLTH
jgi:murein DD-endopeptidase MepM/ murein hydrolase activator NlpD